MRLPIKINVLVPAAVLVAALVLVMPRAQRFGKEYVKGQPWKYETLVAQFDFPILKTEQQLLKERSEVDSKKILYLRSVGTAAAEVAAAVKALSLEELEMVSALRTVRDLYERGVAPDNLAGPDVNTDFVYVQKSKRAQKVPFSEIVGISEAKSIIAEALGRRVPELESLLIPDLVLDEAATDLVNSEKYEDISPTAGYAAAGQVIVEQGEIVTSEIAQLIDSYKAEYESSLGRTSTAGNWEYLAGNSVIAIVIVMILMMIIYFANKRIFEDKGTYCYLLTVFYVAALTAFLTGRSNSEMMLMVPFTLSALYLQAFFRNRVIVPVYIASLTPLLLASGNGIAMFIMYALAGVVAIWSFRFFGRGWRQFITAGITFLVLAVAYFGFYLTDIISGSIQRDMLHMFIGSMLTVAGYPLIYLFERIFNLVSNSRLAELCDTSNSLLHELETKAPGTFQHSLQVMNMVDATARAIGANEQLVRAGALYHDVGKICNPLCFVENESMIAASAGEVGYHSGLSPLHSAQDIIRHVADGVELARKHRLPKVLVELIETHHGTTTAAYFLNKYIEEGGDPSQVSEFSYHGPRPSSKEQILLMLCDSVEAASRTVKDKNFDAFVESIVDGKMAAGQFENADITIRELGIVKDTLKAYLAQLYHGRIEYKKSRKSK